MWTVKHKVYEKSKNRTARSPVRAPIAAGDRPKSDPRSIGEAANCFFADRSRIDPVDGIDVPTNVRARRGVRRASGVKRRTRDRGDFGFDSRVRLAIVTGRLTTDD